MMSRDLHRIIKYPDLEGIHNDHWARLLVPCRATQTSLRALSRHFNSCKLSVKPLSPGEPVPVPGHPFGEEPVPNSQHELPLSTSWGKDITERTGWAFKIRVSTCTVWTITALQIWKIMPSVLLLLTTLVETFHCWAPLNLTYNGESLWLDTNLATEPCAGVFRVTAYVAVEQGVRWP